MVWKVTGSVTPERMQKNPVHLRMFERALSRANEVWCNSEWARHEMKGFGTAMGIVPAGVDRELFQPVADRAHIPTVLSTSAPQEPRKRLVDLFAAWPKVRSAAPDAVLRVAGAATAQTRDQLLGMLPDEHRESVTFLGSLSSPDLAAEYSSAWLSVSPAVFEALGLSTLESLACGTPVVGADSGQTASLLAMRGAGRLFAPTEPAALAAAVTTQLAATAEVDRSQVRAASAPYDWTSIVADVEAGYERLART
jgi:glycosyltransferase involved in cell wall biosynthesis